MIIRKGMLADVPALLAIYNEEVIHGVANLDLEAKTLKEWNTWFLHHQSSLHPLLVAQEDEKAVGYATLSSYREKQAYISTVELSIYVDASVRGKGIATALMGDILQLAKENPEIHTVVSVITSGNKASVRLHEKFGFTYAGTIKEVGYKMGKFQDIDNFYLLV